MKKNNLLEGIAFTFGGFIILCIGLLTANRIDSILIGFGAGGISSGIVTICKYFYWNAPENRERYQKKMEHEKIELYDELKIKLRDKSGRYAYIIGILIISFSMAVFSVLGKLEIIENSRLIVLYLGGYLIFQIALGIVIFNQLLKKYV